MSPRQRISMMLVLAALAASACGKYDRVRVQAVNDLQCKDVEIEHIDSVRAKITGCGRTMMYFCGIDARGLESCHQEKRDPKVTAQRQAGTDLQCPYETVKVDDGDDGEILTNGCGREAIYICREVLNNFACKRKVSGVTDDAPPTAPGASSAPPSSKKP